MHASGLKRATLVMEQSFRSEHTHICERQTYLYFQLSLDLPLASTTTQTYLCCPFRGQFSSAFFFFSLHAVLGNHQDPGTLGRPC